MLPLVCRLSQNKDNSKQRDNASFLSHTSDGLFIYLDFYLNFLFSWSSSTVSFYVDQETAVGVDQLCKVSRIPAWCGG